MSHIQDILTLVESFVGLTEVKPNETFDDKETPGPDAKAVELRRILALGDHIAPNPYCMAFVKGVLMEVYASNSVARKGVNELLCPHVMTSYNRCKKRNFITKTPSPGMIFFMQHGSSNRGHAGFVLSVEGNQIETVEGNTSKKVRDVRADRNGDGVFIKSRTNTLVSTSGLWIKGFALL